MQEGNCWAWGGGGGGGVLYSPPLDPPLHLIRMALKYQILPVGSFDLLHERELEVRYYGGFNAPRSNLRC